jgi:hypothetical protein
MRECGSGLTLDDDQRKEVQICDAIGCEKKTECK